MTITRAARVRDIPPIHIKAMEIGYFFAVALRRGLRHLSLRHEFFFSLRLGHRARGWPECGVSTEMVEANRSAILPLILIVEGNPFFARDLADSVKETSSVYDVVTVAALSDALPIALAAIADERPFPAAIIHAPTRQITDSGIGALLAGAGGRVIVVEGDEPPERIVSMGWKWLGVPITPELIWSAITEPLSPGPIFPEGAPPG